MMDAALFEADYPSNERDLLGLIYQCLLCEGEKNLRGSYYTPANVVKNMTAHLGFSNNQTYLDPCCGSGSFLLALEASSNNIFGIDNDPIAVFICKVNLLLKYKDPKLEPQIYCADYLQDNSAEGKLPSSFDYIITNPPWGALNDEQIDSDIKMKDSFSLFFINAYKQLKDGGIARFLFPKSILNIKTHNKIRAFILNNGNLDSITFYDNAFTGVTTQYIDIQLSKAHRQKTMALYSTNGGVILNKEFFYNDEDNSFCFYNDNDSIIIEAVQSQCSYTLQDSIWALGIVTGDNKRKLLSSPCGDTEAIYTGKEVQQYRLKVPTHYIRYIREDFQQVAKDEYYRAKEKLVYKFISNRLAFAYDDSCALFLNSANILIPKIPNMSIKTVMAFLNSDLYQYLYRVLFSDIKILKGNLIKLPFPNISQKQDAIFSFYAEKIMKGEDSFIPILQNAIYEFYGITAQQKKYIKEYLYGTLND